MFRPADERRFKAEFSYDDRKGVGRVIVDPPGLERECSALLYESVLNPSFSTTTTKASERVITDPLGLELPLSSCLGRRELERPTS